MKISLRQQIEEVETELTMRSHVYPRLVSQKKMRQSDATYRTARMEAALRTLKWLERHKEIIKGITGTAVGEERKAGNSPVLAVHEEEESR